MQITNINNHQAKFELNYQEIKVIQQAFVEVRKSLDYEPEFQTRVGSYYTEVQNLITSICNSVNTKSNKNNLHEYIASIQEIMIVNNILNEACHGVNIEDFDSKIGVSKDEAKSYLLLINKIMNELYSHANTV